MGHVIKLLEAELESHRTQKEWFKSWLTNAKKSNNQYGIEYYREWYNFYSNGIPQIENAIKYLKQPY